MNRFVSFLEHVGRGFKKGLDIVLPVASGLGEMAVSVFAPTLGPLFNQTVAAVVTAEQNATAIGKSTGSGPQKLASVISLMEGLIKQALADVGKPQDDAEVEKYISAIVTILNIMPAPVPAPLPPVVVVAPNPPVIPAGSPVVMHATGGTAVEEILRPR